MLSTDEFIKQSLAMHLFFMRIMKEHAFFLQVAFTPKNSNLANQADSFRKTIDSLLETAIGLSNGVVSREVLQSGEVITPYTLKAEMGSSFYTGVTLQTSLTQAEAGLTGGETVNDSMLEQKVHSLNSDAIKQVNSLIQFKSLVLSEVMSCNLYTTNYPLLLDHIIREAKIYLSMIQKLQNREDIHMDKEAYEQETFWNQIMAEHSKFIRGLLDPTENDLIRTANKFGTEFDQLTIQAKQAMNQMMPLTKVTADSLDATKNIREFKVSGVQGILSCKIKSIIMPLLADHVLREANHYLRLLQMFERVSSPAVPTAYFEPADLPVSAQPKVELKVFAAASLKDVLNSIKSAYEMEHPNTIISYNFGGSGVLQQQIEQGAPSDIFFSAGKKQMQTLQDENLMLSGTVRDLLGNKLVLITPRNGNNITSFQDLKRDDIKKIAIGDPRTVPAGQYAQQTFDNLKLTDAIQSKLIYGQDVRQVLSWVENGMAQAGVVYSTDALTSPNVQISDVAPSFTHDPIVYPIGIVRASQHPKQARDFINYLSKEDGKKIFEKYGFIIPV